MFTSASQAVNWIESKCQLLHYTNAIVELAVQQSDERLEHWPGTCLAGPADRFLTAATAFTYDVKSERQGLRMIGI